MGVLDKGWLGSFVALHERAKRGKLLGPELAAYRVEREGMKRTLLAAQQAALGPGQSSRHSLRVSCALQLDVNHRDQVEHTAALNVSTGGFAALLALSPQVGDEVSVMLSIPGGKPLLARARVANVRQHRQGSDRVRAGFQFVAIEAADIERLEVLVFDAILEHLKD